MGWGESNITQLESPTMVDPPDIKLEELGYSELFEFLSMGIGITIVAIIGLFGNLLSACVLNRSAMRSSITPLLLGLTFSDSVLILSSLLLFGLPVLFSYCQLIQNNSYMEYFFPKWGPTLYPIAIIGQTASVYFTIAITIERYLVVCWPLQSRSLCTWKRTKVAAGMICIFAIVYNIPRWWELEGIEEITNNTVTNELEIIYRLDFTSFREDPIYINYYINWAYLVTMCLFPFIILLTLNLLIYTTIRRSNRSRHGIIVGPIREYSFACVLFCVTTSFLIFNSLAFVINLMESMWSFSWIDLENLSNFLITLNSSVNCAIYCAVGNKFRVQLFQMKDEMSCSARGLLATATRKLPSTFRIQFRHN